MTKKQDKQNTISQEEFDKLQSELDGVKDLSAQLETQLKRAVADYQNLERRVSEGRSELSSWASASLIDKLLPTLDHLEMVVELGRDTLAQKEETKEWFRGVELAVNQLKQTLSDEGLEEIPTDGVFNPSLHEAVDTQEGEDGSIIRVAQRGYTLGGKVLRPTKVVVGRQQS